MRAAVCASFLLASCQHTGVDGGDADASAADAGADAPRDATDADGDSADTIPDVGPSPFGAGWGLVPGCKGAGTWFADAAGRASLQLRWAPCASGRPGCQRAIVDWTSAAGDVFFAQGPLWADGGLALAYTRQWPDVPDRTIEVLQRPSGQVVNGLGYVPPRTCTAVTNYGRDSQLLTITHSFTDPVRLFSLRSYVFESPSKGDYTVDFRSLTDDGGNLGLGAISLGLGRVYVTTKSVESIATFDSATGAVLRRASATLPAERPVATPFGVIYHRIGRQSLYRLDLDGRPVGEFASFAPRELGAFLLDPKTLDVVSVDLAWDSSSPTDFTVRVKNAADLSAAPPRRVTRFASSGWSELQGSYIVADGMAAVRLDDLTLRVIRLSDGRSWDLAPEPDDRWAYPLYVDRGELWATVDLRSTAGGWLRGRGLVKYPLVGEPPIPAD